LPFFNEATLQDVALTLHNVAPEADNTVYPLAPLTASHFTTTFLLPVTYDTRVGAATAGTVVVVTTAAGVVVVTTAAGVVVVVVVVVVVTPLVPLAS
jgi:hypothetical protein